VAATRDLLHIHSSYLIDNVGVNGSFAFTPFVQ
jgi:hypothetical protein